MLLFICNGEILIDPCSVFLYTKGNPDTRIRITVALGHRLVREGVMRVSGGEGVKCCQQVH